MLANNYKSEARNITGIIIIIIAAAVVFISAAVIGFVKFSPILTGKAEPTATAVPTEAPTATQTVVSVPNAITPIPGGAVSAGSEGEPPRQEPPAQPKEREASAPQSASGYQTYSSSKFSFSCAYPASFRATNVTDNFILYSCESPDSNADLYINGTENSSGLSPSTVYSNFVSTYGGVEEFKNIGDNFCAGRIINGARSHYCYYKLTNGMIRGFEMHYPTSQDGYYDGLINDIYSRISFY